jgi:hypothetical protein
MGCVKSFNSALKGVSASVISYLSYYGNVSGQIQALADLTFKHRPLVPTEGCLNYVIAVLMVDKLFK